MGLAKTQGTQGFLADSRDHENTPGPLTAPDKLPTFGEMGLRQGMGEALSYGSVHWLLEPLGTWQDRALQHKLNRPTSLQCKVPESGEYAPAEKLAPVLCSQAGAPGCIAAMLKQRGVTCI